MFKLIKKFLIVRLVYFTNRYLVKCVLSREVVRGVAAAIPKFCLTKGRIL